jgi:hypothetical protein
MQADSGVANRTNHAATNYSLRRNVRMPLQWWLVLSRIASSFAFAFVTLLAIGTVNAAPVGTAFNFSGELRDGTNPASGPYDFRVSLYLDANTGTPLATQTIDGLLVDRGIFTLALDFTSAPFEAGQLYYLEVNVRQGGSTGPYETLSPRVTVRPVPYAIEALGVKAGSVGATDIDPLTVQARIGGSCPAGQSIRAVAADGTVTCQIDNVGTGTLTAVTAGAGIQVTGASPAPVVGIANAGISRAMLSPSVVDAAAVDSSQVQLRVASSCVPGSYMRGVSAAGVPVCVPINPPPPPPAAIGSNVRTQLVVNSCSFGAGAKSAYSLARASNGLPLALVGGCFSSANPYILRCQDASCASSTSTTLGIQANISSPNNVSIASGPGGLIAMTSGAHTLLYTRCVDANCSSNNLSALVTLDATAGSFATDMIFASDGFPIVAYIGPTDNSLRVVKCGTADCGAPESALLSNTAASAGERDLAIGASPVGNPGIAFVGRQANGAPRARFIRCANAGCTTAVAPAVDYALGSVGVTPSVVIPPDDRPVISHFDADNLDLLVTRCGDAGCTADNVTTVVASLGSTGYGADIVLIGGLPVISYIDVTNSRVMVVRCGNMECSEGNGFGVVSQESQALDRTRMIVDPSGRPNVAAGNGTSAFFYRCANVACD